MQTPIPDAKLHRLLITDAEVKRIIEALDHSLTLSMPHRTTNSLLSLRAMLRRSQPS